MRFKKTRIAVSVFCGMLCLLLIGLWIRNQSTADAIQVRVNPRLGVHICSVLGTVDFLVANLDLHYSWRILHTSCSGVTGPTKYSIVLGHWYFGAQGFTVPCWFLVLLTGTFAGVVFPYRQIEWRFSLKSLLICVTCVSLILGLIVYITRN